MTVEEMLRQIRSPEARKSIIDAALSSAPTSKIHRDARAALDSEIAKGIPARDMEG